MLPIGNGIFLLQKLRKEGMCMTKPNLGWNEKKLKRFLNEGRGQGEGEHYVPWTKVHEFSSKGRVTRIFGIKTNRIHHLHSDNQLRAFLIFEWCDRVVDIRECFPLLDIMEVVDDKANLRFDKFCDKDTGEQLVITTNFLLTVKESDGSKRYVARTVKNTTELNKKITFEKLEIERRYWHSRGVDWKVITEKELDRQYCKNLEWIREVLLENDEKYNGVEKETTSNMLHQIIMNNQDSTLRKVLKDFEEDEGLDSGEGLYLFRYLVAKKRLRIDLKNKINLSRKVKEIIKDN
ncbi:MAG: heteromeric transposase endonuclease subunit TnsA [Candidatus Moranbacteria bacterium]|nr:heteromeric transposase endonuclease subunit TnsA [Candidatus Moranbacteria bacterium]